MFTDLMALLKNFGGLLGKMFSTRLGGWIASALVFFGLSWTTYTFGVAPFRSLIEQSMGGGGQFIAWAGFLGIDKAVTIVLSAIGVKYGANAAKVALTRGAV